jgi:serine/threonine protein kinase
VSTRTGPLDPSPPAAPASGIGRPLTGPQRIGRYEVLSEIASGGMGRVYLGRARGPLGFEKLVALKTIHPELAREQAFVDMFFDEARIAARIDHENVCRVFDFGEADGQYFLAMEYLVGVNLGRVMRAVVSQRTRDPGFDVLAAHVVAQAAEGLHAAHELADQNGRSLGVVHRDVSPQNIFLTFDGGVRVVDFGIASAEGRRHQTATGSLKGKLSYMAPEQLRREKADRRADVWALGVVLWEMLTWERCFRGETEVDTVLAVLNDGVRAPRSVRPSIDPELDAIVMAALAKDRDARLETARALSQRLREHVVRRGVVVGSAELTTFLARLLPDERTRALAAVEEARRTPAETTRDTTPSPAPPLMTEPRALAGTPLPPHDGSRTREIDAPVVVPHAATTPRLSGAAIGLIAVAATAGAFFVGQSFAGRDVPDALVDPLTTVTEPAPALPPETTSTTAPSSAATTTASTTEPAAAEPVAATPDVAPPQGAVPGRTKTTSRRRVSPIEGDTGVLVVTTPGGWADVYADGRRIGRTPLTTSLPAGRVSLELRPFTQSLPDDPRAHPSVTIGSRITTVTVPLGSNGRPR